MFKNISFLCTSKFSFQIKIMKIKAMFTLGVFLEAA